MNGSEDNYDSARLSIVREAGRRSSRRRRDEGMENFRGPTEERRTARKLGRIRGMSN